MNLPRLGMKRVARAQALIAEALARHSMPVLEISGGKDSTAVLELARPWWDRLTVVWLNTGDPLPTTVAFMAWVKSQVPHFVELQGRQPEVVARYGWPSDIVPQRHTVAGQLVFGPQKFSVQQRIDCCWRSLMQPMDEQIRALGATLAMRGRRHDEADRSPARSGMTADGLEVLFPIYDWTADDVWAYLAAQGAHMTDFYEVIEDSIDCMHCTAWLEHRHLDYLDAKHPDAAAEVRRRMGLIYQAAAEPMRALGSQLVDK